MRNLKPPPSFCICAGRIVSYLVGNPEDRFSRDEAHISWADSLNHAYYRKFPKYSDTQIS